MTSKVDPKEIVNAFKFEPGEHVYVLEIKTNSGLTRDDMQYVLYSFLDKGIRIIPILTDGDTFSINAVPAIEKHD